MTIGSLFSGIGGLELGLELAGLGPTMWQCEIDPFCRRVLEKHWPDAERFGDVEALHFPPRVDVMCGGFPCQDVSSANTKARGLKGHRSGLWKEYARIVGEVAPRVVVVENVASGAKRWLPFVRRDLESLGYRTRAFRILAADVGALHPRARIFVVAYAHGKPLRLGQPRETRRRVTLRDGGRIADVDGDDRQTKLARARLSPRQQRAKSEREVVADAARNRTRNAFRYWPSEVVGAWPEPNVVRVVHGVSSGLDVARRKALGNAVVPQCALAVGRFVAAVLRGEATF